MFATIDPRVESVDWVTLDPSRLVLRQKIDLHWGHAGYSNTNFIRLQPYETFVGQDYTFEFDQY